MYKKIYLTAALLAVFIVGGSSVSAENIIEISGNDTMSRLDKAVVSQKLVLDESARLSIANNCQNAQIILRDVLLSADKATRRRVITYGNIQKDLQSIKFRMMRQGSDASETDLLYGKLQQLSDQFTLQADRYGTTLDDILTINCQQKPEHFKAGLILARAQQAKLFDIVQKADKAARDRAVYEQLKKRLVL